MRKARKLKSAQPTLTKVFKVFNDLQKANSTQKTHVFELIQALNNDPINFKIALQQAYLKIFKNLRQKGNKKNVNKFQSFTDEFFKVLLSIPKQQKPAKNQFSVLNFFILFLSQAIFSTIINIKVMSGRILFMIVKQINPSKIQQYLQQETCHKMMHSVLHLLRQKTSTSIQIGTKLSSLVMGIQDNNHDEIQQELFKIIATQDNQQIRKMVAKNIPITNDNIDNILIRLRDKDPQIRVIIIQKLDTQNYLLQNMTQTNIYKLLYDGYGNKQIIVKQECFEYFKRYFTTKQNNKMQLDTFNSNIRQKFASFVEMFQPIFLLQHPHLYSLFNELISNLLIKLPQLLINQYLQYYCLLIKNNKNRNINNMSNELIWLKNTMISQDKNLSAIYQQQGPSGLELSKILLELMKIKNIYGMYEILQIFIHQITPDQIGRNKMFDSLKILIVQLDQFQPQIDYKTIFKNDDICPKQTVQVTNRRKLLLSYYDLPIINNSLDLILQIGIAMKKLRPQHYQIQMKEIMSEWNNPQENTLQKQKQITLINLTRTKQSKELKLLNILQQKLKTIEKCIHCQHIKTRLVILILSKLKQNSNICQYMLPYIKKQINSKNKSYGLILLALYCLDSYQNVQNFLPLFWYHLITEKTQKNDILVSLKCITDFVTKFNIIHQQLRCDEGTDKQYNGDLLIKKLIILMLGQDVDIRILSIECLCRLIYHDKIDDCSRNICFIYILLIWWQTNINKSSNKSVHIISIFIRNYIERGQQQVHKLSENLCIFFQMLIKLAQNNQFIDRNKIRYNLTFEEFIKKALSISINILRYHKVSQKCIFQYFQPQLGPQQLFVLFIAYQPKLCTKLNILLPLCDFYEQCPLQTLILMKQKIQDSLNSQKKPNQTILKFINQLDDRIQINKTSMYDEQSLLELKKTQIQFVKLIKQETKLVIKNLKDYDLIVKEIQSIDLKLQNDFNDLSEQLLSVTPSVRKKKPNPLDEEQFSSKSMDHLPRNQSTNTISKKIDPICQRTRKNHKV